MGFGIPDNICNTSLFLGLGDPYCDKQENLSLPDHQKKLINNNKKKNISLKKDHLFPSLSLGLPQETCSKVDPDSPSAVSVSSNTTIVKMEKEMVGGGRGDQEVEAEEEKERVCSRASDEEEGGSPRKKLRLTKEQSTVLEDRFKEQSTLSPKQKFALAEQLNLRPRQVEVWFQNRRARTKLKQTEVDCELLKKCCETLSEENKRLHKEIQELKYSFKHSPPFHIQLSTTSTPTICPSCERIGGGLTSDSSPTSSTVTVRPKTLFYKPLTHPSAA